jgi:hypothetical protein
MVKHPLKKGSLLIAEPSILRDHSFARSVILLSEHNQDGSVGFIVNKPSAYTLNEMMTDLRKNIFSELDKKAPVDMYRRQLQKIFTERIISLVKPAGPMSISFQLPPGFSLPSVSNTSDALSVAKSQLRILQSNITTTLPSITDVATKNHLIDLQDRIKNALNPK